jgi:hypothetical protein
LGYPDGVKPYVPGYVWEDQEGSTPLFNKYPEPTPPGNPLSTQKVTHDSPWRLFVGSVTFGSGVQVRSDTQQYYLDHGRHN